MSDIIQTLKDLYATDKAAALNMLPELFRQADEGKIVELPCKLGAMLWHIYNKDKGPLACYASEDNIFLIAKRINETVFFTYEEADKALKESEKQ